MSMMTILIPIEQHEDTNSALQTALLIARRFDSYIEGFALQSSINEFATFDMGGVSQVSFAEKDIEEAKKIRAVFESSMQELGVPPSGPAASGLSYGWLEDAPDGANTVGSYGRVFDLIVFSRASTKSTGLHNRALEVRPVRKRSPYPAGAANPAETNCDQHTDRVERQQRTDASD